MRCRFATIIDTRAFPAIVVIFFKGDELGNILADRFQCRIHRLLDNFINFDILAQFIDHLVDIIIEFRLFK